MAKLTRNQWVMLRRMYRNQLKEYGYYGTGWTSEFSVHKASIQVLLRRGLVITRKSRGLEFPPGYSDGGWGNYNLYMLSEAGLAEVRANTPVLIGVPVLFNRESYMVVSWDDDYSAIELLKSDAKYPIHVAPNEVQVIAGAK